MTYSDNPVTIASAIKAVVVANQDELDISDVFYGDQVKIPKSPTVCVEPAKRATEYNGTGFRKANTFTCGIYVYVAKLGDVSEIQTEVDQLSYDLAAAIDAASLSGDLADLITWGYCAELNFGYRVKANQLMRCDYIVWTGYNEMCLA